MGYRSDVRSIIYGEPDKLLAFTTAQRLKGSKVFEYLAHSLEQYEVMGTIWLPADDPTNPASLNSIDGIVAALDLNCEDVKWYDTYDDIAWEQLLLDAEEAGLDYEFARVGEDDGDVERKMTDTSQGWLNVTTSIRTYIPDKIKEGTPDGQPKQGQDTSADHAAVLCDTGHEFAPDCTG